MLGLALRLRILPKTTCIMYKRKLNVLLDLLILEVESVQVLETIRVEHQQPDPVMPHSATRTSPVAGPSTEAHPSLWIQDFLHTTLGIARRKRSSSGDAADSRKADQQETSDPASSPGQIQLWQVQ